MRDIFIKPAQKAGFLFLPLGKDLGWRNWNEKNSGDR